MKLFKSNNNQIRTSNVFYNHFVDDVCNIQVFKKAKMVWRKKSATDDSIGNNIHKSPVVDTKSVRLIRTRYSYKG